MAGLVFYTNPMSRGQIARWMLEEIGQPYDSEIIPYEEMKGDRYLAINPMGKVPAIVHDGRLVTECAAICAYLADIVPEAGLAPRSGEKADYYRWLFFAAGPLEAAISNHANGWDPSPERQRMFGYGTFEMTVDTLSRHLEGRHYVCGDRFTAADVYVGSHVAWGIQFGTLPRRHEFEAYAGRLTGREAYRRAKTIDERLIAEMQADQKEQSA